MRILDNNGIELRSPNLDKGYLKKDRLFISHHEAEEGIPEKGHWKTIAKYPNGGADVQWVVDTPGVKAKEAFDEYEDIYRYIEYTPEEQKAILSASLTPQQKLELFARSIPEEPYPDIPPKVGYKYQREYSTSSRSIVWTLVPDLNNPIEYRKGMTVTEGLYYTDGTNKYSCVKSGDPKTLSDAAYLTKI